MFRRPTTFVIGAGASAELGLPVGSALREIISELVNIRFEDGCSQTTGDHEICEALRFAAREGPDPSNDINTYLRAAWQMAQAAPLSLSIDNYLEAHQSNSKAVTVGKLAITKAILDAESRSKLAYDWREGEGFDLKASEGTWLVRFFQMASEGVTASEVLRIFENVSLVVFNYDRCIEHFLITALKSYYALCDGDALKILATLNIFHPYGTVGPLASSGSLGVRFGAEKQGGRLLELSRSIKTFSEQIDDNDSLRSMRQWLRESDQVVFVGFAFHRQNLDILDVQLESRLSRIIGTCLGISGSDTNVIRTSLPNYLHCRLSEVSIDLMGTTCSDILDQYWRTITA